MRIVKRIKRYRYYVSQRVIKDATSVSARPGRIGSGEIERLVLITLESSFSSADQVVSALDKEDDDLGVTRRLIESGAG